MKKRMIALDADPLIFEVTEGKNTKSFGFKRKNTGSKKIAKKKYKEPLKPYKEKLRKLIQDIEDEIAVNYVGQVKGVKVCFSDPKTNFRYGIYPEYKANREAGDRGELFYRLRKWALKKYGYVKGCEADDVVSYLVLHKNHIGATFDKDMLKGVEGDWFDTYHARRSFHTTSPMEARNFNLIQTLTGDATDNIKALPKRYGDEMIDGVRREGIRKPFKVTEKLAIELLDQHGWNWKGVIKAYISKGFTEKEAILTRRLICMRQWTPKKGVQLWQPPKRE